MEPLIQKPLSEGLMVKNALFAPLHLLLRRFEKCSGHNFTGPMMSSPELGSFKYTKLSFSSPSRVLTTYNGYFKDNVLT